MLIRCWLTSVLPNQVLAIMNSDGSLSNETEKTLGEAVANSLNIQSQKILLLMHGVWSRISSMICSECKTALQAVKGVAGKYRLTNKPPPETPSPFVGTILTPLRYVYKTPYFMWIN